MGRILCSTHGLSPIRNVCRHLHLAMPSRRLPRSHVYGLEIVGVPEVEEWSELHFCDECVLQRRLPVPARRLTEAEQDGNFRDSLVTEPVCAHCFDILP